MKILFKIIGVILLLSAIIAIFGSIGLGDIKKLTINEVDLSTVADGVYYGKFHKVRWTYEVKVTTKDHKITAIETTGKLPPSGRNKIIDEAIAVILAKQSVKIDAVSGATVDTKAFCKAVENALIKNKG
jgi:uncharacterized protein with FMN-binding domain